MLSALPMMTCRRAATVPDGAAAYVRLRQTNIDTSRTVCAALDELGINGPTVNLHGDAHIEQYVVTSSSSGLRDFDDACRGPAALDFVRFIVSIHVAGAVRPDHGAQTNEVEAAFVAGYRQGLGRTAVPEPTLASRVRSTFTTKNRFWARDDRVSPTSADEGRAVMSVVEGARRALEQQDRLSAGFLSPVAVGRLKLGVGSRHRRKYLVRVRGRTDAPNDDEFFELKELSNLSSIPCVIAEPDRVRRVQGTMARPPAIGVGAIQIDGVRFWTHVWPRHYWAVDVRTITAEDLKEISFASGVQLAVGHRASAASTNSFAQMLAREAALRALARSLAVKIVESVE